MSSGVLWALSFALLLAAAGVMLWRGSQLREQSAHTRRFFDSRLEAGAKGAVPAGAAGGAGGTAARQAAPAAGQPARPASRPAAPAKGLAAWRAKAEARWLGISDRAGLDEVRGLLYVLAGLVLLAMLVAGARGGGVAAGAALLGGVALACLWVLRRISARRLKIVQQLPSFLDGVVRLVTLGNSVPAAFQGALGTTEMPLRRCLDQVSRMLRTGVEIDRAMLHIAKEYRVREFELVGSVLRLSVKYGGRADVMLERMATFMRDLEQAERELHAMSAETRLSAWVLGLLPVAVGSFVVSTNPQYFTAMWMNESGRLVLYVAFGLQMLGGYLLYRMARLR
ncbi:pilus assembly protein [Burkholderia glumae]|uniref:type II secretion system F family protein n=1 Tax=Burkholderia glumae TaxID=337 RepID=UPI000C28102C|nr:type II secretion system F family protein [Burkholderia glumae]MCM2493471.1 type II secretion system F family protein [Burkholderia glumae]MCM2543969.1 type II secretion system F family protein [Burkholderia glumae]MCQ0030426.1 type II secretion system F family protein [Burkholderia glumae]PJO23209.1 pilus assembly protein [Burkholderia glumae AU6208]QHE09234.1 pilus assembly protein [Burkholderia glumae AU6208]